MSEMSLSRRAFLAATTTSAVMTFTGAAAAPNTAKVVPRKVSPNEKLNVAAIGAGGKGAGDITGFQNLGENVVALCDVDWDRAARVFGIMPNVPKYKDFRNMLEKHPEIDAVNVSTPDHMHAPAAYMAMKMGKHVYVQKPLTHTVAEARLLTLTAREMGVATQMGNQGHSDNGCRELCEMIWSNAIGNVQEAHVWTHRPVWKNQGRGEPFEPQTPPEGLDWDRWLGPAPWRPFNKAYAPHDWRAWQDFGAGSLGDMACHIMDPVYMCLKLNERPWFTVEVVMQEGVNKETFPLTSTIKYHFAAGAGMPEVDVYWNDGHWPDPKNPAEKIYNRPKRPAGIPDTCVLGDNDMNGSFLIGENGIITQGEYGGNPRLVPDEKMASYKKPDPTIPRIKDQDHFLNFLEACKGGEPACSNFDYSGPFTEMVQFGNLVVKSGKKLRWDNVKGEVTNVRNAKEIVSKEYRKGWELPC